ncbi:hypothetical protein C8R46DRAFT_990796 [Mycena filopes]|nr:hypothetical protein C8R46DRAFT_990796 [Mycena filopes]
MATLKPQIPPDSMIEAELRVKGAQDILVAGVNRVFVRIRAPSHSNQKTNVSQTAEWNHTFPRLSLPLSSNIEFQIRNQRWFKSKLLAQNQATIEDLVNMADENNLVTLPMKPYKPLTKSPNLHIFIQLRKPDVASVSQQLAGLQVVVASSAPRESIQKILRRLEWLTRFTGGIAQIHPIANAAYSVAKAIGQIIIKDHLGVNDNVLALLDEVYAVLDFVEHTQPMAAIETFPHIVEDILACVVNCVLLIGARERANPVGILLSDNKYRVEKLRQRLQELHTQFSDLLTLGVAAKTDQIANNMHAIVDDQHLAKLKPIPVAMDGSTCLPGTRSSVIAKLTEWGLLSTNKFLWIHGSAGSGKSTISTTMATVFESLGQLGSFVFFRRDVEGLSDAFGIIRTMAYQLAHHHEDIAEGVRSAVQKQSLIADMPMDLQFQRLLVEPLTGLDINQRIIIIVDALDEARNNKNMEDLLSLLSRGFTQLPDFVRILITSRRYPGIQRTLENIPNLRIFDLNEADSVEDDIRTYIWAQMDSIRRQDLDLPPGWPGKDSVDSLVGHAHGLFIWARVACAYIKAYKPATRIQILLSSPAIRAVAEHSLNDLYGLAIREAGPWHEEDFAQEMHSILALIVVSSNPQSCTAIGEFFGMSSREASKLITPLSSILGMDKNGQVHVIHPSVRDYLVDPNRCGSDLPWHVSEEEEHVTMGAHCVRQLTGKLSATIDPVPWDQQACMTLPDAVKYACLSWVYHTCSTSPAVNLAEKIHTFLCKHFLHWVQALSILGKSRNAIVWLEQLQVWYSKLHQVSKMSLTLVDGPEKLIIGTHTRSSIGYPFI